MQAWNVCPSGYSASHLPAWDLDFTRHGCLSIYMMVQRHGSLNCPMDIIAIFYLLEPSQITIGPSSHLLTES